MKCYLCSHINAESARFCVECGTPFYKTCENCGKESLFSNKFCPNCGNAFNAQQDALTRYKRKLTFYDSIETWKIRDNIIPVRKNGLYGIFNLSTQNLVIPCEYESYKFESKDFIFLKKNNHWNIYNPLTGNKISKDSFEEIEKEDNRSFACVKRNGLWGMVSCKNGTYLINTNYEMLGIADWHANRKLAKKDGLWGCIEYSENSNPQITIPFEFIQLNTFATEDKPRPSQHKNKKWGVVLSNGNRILDFEYDEIIYHEPCGHSLYYLRKGNLWGLFFSGGRYSKDAFFHCIHTKKELENLKY